jgi:hypothetical protein
MKRFLVSARAFFSGTGELGKRAFSTYSVDVRERCERPMRELIARLGISGAVLSVGAATAHEEYWFCDAGCRLTLGDIDEHEVLQPYLESIVAEERSCSDPLVYLIGDAAELAHTALPGGFDACYFSSFTPDEARREEIQRSFDSRPRQILNSVAARLPAALRTLIQPPTWPNNELPFGPMVMGVVEKQLKQGGWFISQSYFGGVDVTRNRHYIDLMRRQLRQVGVELLEVHYFVPATYPVSLTIGVRAETSAAVGYARLLRGRPQLSNFHGRSDIARTIGHIDCGPS